MNNQNSEYELAEYVLLLGAGFTKNFGGLLAEEMWTHIFNHGEIQAQPRIKKLMLNNFDYEDIYYSVLENLKDKESLFLPIEFTDEEKKAIKNATKYAYEYIDEIIRNQSNLFNPLSPYKDLVSSFKTLRKKYQVIWPDGKIRYEQFGTENKSFIFTLNQDLFFERIYWNNSVASLSIPGIPNDVKWFKSNFNEPLEQEDYIKLPSKDELKSIENDLLNLGNFFLIKLHGSFNWKSSDGSDIMVIGRSKNRQIENEPLLCYYYEVFKKVLSQTNRRLLIIGYGFGDEHINSVISNAVENYGLKIYILSPEPPNKLKERLCAGCKKETVNIWYGISGYSQKVEEILRNLNNESTTIREHFYNNLFGKSEIEILRVNSVNGDS